MPRIRCSTKKALTTTLKILINRQPGNYPGLFTIFAKTTAKCLPGSVSESTESRRLIARFVNLLSFLLKISCENSTQTPERAQ